MKTALDVAEVVVPNRKKRPEGVRALVAALLEKDRGFLHVLKHSVASVRRQAEKRGASSNVKKANSNLASMGAAGMVDSWLKNA